MIRIGFDAKRLFHNTTGLGNYSRDLLRIFGKYFPENQYVLYNPKPKKIDLHFPKKNFKEILPQGFLNEKIPAFWRTKNIVKQLQKDNLQIYHGLSGELPLGIEKIKSKKILTIHDLIFCRYPELYSFWDRKIHFQKVFHAAKKADIIIAMSAQTKKDITHFLKIHPEKIQVIYQGCHKIFKQPLEDSFIKTTLEKYQIPDTFFLNVGTIEPRKNLLNIVKAFKNLDENLVVVGKKTHYFKEVLDYIKNKKTLRVHFLEGISMEELAVLYKKAIASIYLSIFEGFGIPIIESIYSNTPVITSKGGCFGEAGGAVAFYVNPLNIKEISEKIQEISKDNSLYQKKQKLREQHLKKFEDSHIANAYFKMYQEILKK